jgi:hypothetical protein
LKIARTILPLIISTVLYGQDNSSKNFVGLQFGGQALVGLSYDRTIISKDFFKVNVATGIVINEYADDTAPSDRPIYGLNLGVNALYDIKIKYLFIETGFYSSPYFYESLTFINYYSWLGVRINSKTKDGGYASIGWTPSLYFSKIPPNFYNNVKIGIKLGFNF